MRKLTKRERAIEICKNLTQTIDKIQGAPIEHKNEVFEIPRAKKSALIKLKNEIGGRPVPYLSKKSVCL